jgi:hypothetical protein
MRGMKTMLKATLSVLVLLSLMFRAGSGCAQTNSVVIESKQVLPGATNLTVGVYFSNAIPIVALVLQLEFREIDAGAYLQTVFVPQMNPAGRMWHSVLGYANPEGPNAIPTERKYDAPAGIPCSGPTSSTYQGTSTLLVPSSPDGFLFETHSVADESGDGGIDFHPGMEVPGVDIPSYSFTFDVSNVSGRFEIDTCCIRPTVHLIYVNRNTEAVPVQFTKGIITIGCFCRCHGDPECDGAADILDVVRAVNTAFRNAPEVTDQDCTHSRTDLDASGVTNVIDVARLIDLAMNNGQPEEIVSDPCAQ